MDRLDVEHWNLLGTPLPEVALQTLEGQPISSLHYAGQEHLLLLTDPRCSLCDKAYPVLRAASAEGLPVLMVAQNGLAETRAKIAQADLTFPVAYDSMGVLSDPLRVTGFPMIVWVGADGKLRKASVGIGAVKAIAQMALSSRAATTTDGG